VWKWWRRGNYLFEKRVCIYHYLANKKNKIFNEQMFNLISLTFSCRNIFCNKCIKRNLGRDGLKNITESDEWACFECDNSQITYLRAQYYFLIAVRYRLWALTILIEESTDLFNIFFRFSAILLQQNHRRFIHCSRIDQKPQ